LQEELANLRTRYGDDHPEIRRVKAELAGLRPDPVEPDAAAPADSSASNAAQEPAPSLQAPDPIIAAKERVGNIKAQLSAAAKEFETANATRTRVLRDIEVYQSRINRLPVREQELAGLTRDYETAKSNYQALLTQKLSAEMATDRERNQQGDRFTLINAAQVPSEPFKPNRPLFYALGVVLSLLVSALLVLGRQVPKGAMLGEWELAPGVVILGRVPKIEIPKTKLAALAPGGPSN
jgi:uncharacterized protein involved in exopolysaccharide biosynthesis